MSDEQTDWQDGELKVVVNAQGQYSIWPLDRDNPIGWDDAGKTGSKDACLGYIKEHWTDLSPAEARD